VSKRNNCSVDIDRWVANQLAALATNPNQRMANEQAARVLQSAARYKETHDAAIKPIRNIEIAENIEADTHEKEVKDNGDMQE